MKKLISYILILTTATMLSLSLNTSFAYADDSDPDQKFQPPIIPKADYLPGPDRDQVEKDGSRKILTQRVLPRYAVGLIGFVGGLSLVFLIIGGVRFTMAYGKEESVENAKKQVIYAIVGLLIALLSFTVVSIITSIELDSDTTRGPAVNTGDGLAPAGEMSEDAKDALEDSDFGAAFDE